MPVEAGDLGIRGGSGLLELETQGSGDVDARLRRRRPPRRLDRRRGRQDQRGGDRGEDARAQSAPERLQRSPVRASRFR